MSIASCLLRTRIVCRFALTLLLIQFVSEKISAQNVVVSYGDVWKYNIPTSDPGTAWRTTAFNDASWASGAGLLGFETSPLPQSGIQTVVGTTGSQMVYLFRKTFTYSGPTSGATVAIDQIVDDGVTYYLNGNLLGSSGHTPGAWDNAASRAVGDAVEEYDVVNGPATGLVSGTNVLTAEVHQNGSGSSDLVFGARLKINTTAQDSAAWRTQYFGNSANSGPGADTADGDKDGLPNMVEYALALDPNKFIGTWGSAAFSGTDVTLTYLRRKAALNELTFTCQWATNPSSTWSSTGVVETILADDGFSQEVRATVALSGSTKKFLRLQIVRQAVSAPTAPSNLVATAASTSQINLSWTDNSSNETGFKIERRQSATTTWVALPTTAAGVTTYQDTGLIAGTKYYYHVCSTNAAGSSANTTDSFATTNAAPATIPAAPSNLVATAASTSQINLTWTDNSNDETGFIIERRQSGTPNFAQIATPGAGVTTFSDTGLTAGTKYYYHIRSTNSVGDSVNTTDSFATTNAAPPSIPLTPSNLAATATSTTQIGLTWSDNSSDETGFKVERKPSGGSYSEVGAVGAGVTSYNDSNLTASSQYFYRVRATNSAGDSNYSGEANATTMSAPPSTPNIPSNLAANATSSSQINVTWTDTANNETGFKIERKTNGGNYTQVGTTGANVTSFGDTGLSASTQYFYRIRGNNGAGDSGYSNEASATTQAPPATGVTESFVQAPRISDQDTPTAGALLSGANLVRSASLSSSDTKFDSNLDRLRDGQVIYWAENSWISPRQDGATVRVSWGSPQTLDRVWIFGSATIISALNHGKLHFSDGTTYDFGPVPDHYEVPGLEISFPAKTVSWVDVEITNSRNRGTDAGAVIGELAMFNGLPAGVNHISWNQPFTWHDTPPGGCPFPQSSNFANIRFTGRHIEYEGADTWYPTWATDGNMYSPYADGNVRGHELACYGGNPETGNIKIVGDDPMNLNIIYLGKTSGSPGPSYDARYPCGSLCYNGVWYYGTYVCNDNFIQFTDSGGTTHDVNWQYCGALCGFRTSTDYGQNWNTGSAPYPRGASSVQGLFPEPASRNAPVKFGTPHFVDFGQNMQHSPDGKAYIVGHGAVASDPSVRPVANCSWITGDSVYMARVTPSINTINDESQWEYFGGVVNGNPTWTHDLNAAQPIADWNNHMGCVTMTYNAPLHKYMMVVVDGRWTADDMDTYIMESDNIYGPWKMVSYMSAFGTQGYFSVIPSKFISADGRKMWLSYSANFHGYNGQRFDKPEGGRYAWCLREFTLQ